MLIGTCPVIVQFDGGGDGLTINIVAYTLGFSPKTLAHAQRLYDLLKSCIPFEFEPSWGVERAVNLHIVGESLKIHMEISPLKIGRQEAIGKLEKLGFTRGIQLNKA